MSRLRRRGGTNEVPLPGGHHYSTILYPSPSTTGTTIEHAVLIYSLLRIDSAIKRLYSR